jgi:SAM-dependent methyltransferase
VGEAPRDERKRIRMTNGSRRNVRIARGDHASWKDYYVEYQRRLSEFFLIPFLEENRVTIDGAAVLDVGCGNGGVTAVFAERASHAVGIDVGDFDWFGIPGVEFRKADFTDPVVALPCADAFDIVLLRDVIEHVRDKRTLLAHVAASLRGAGHVLVTFPPYYSAYGPHQQNVLTGSPLRRLPFMHWHPGTREIARTRTTIRGFERLALECGLAVAARRLYLTRPSFEVRYGVPTVRFRVPWLLGFREVLTTGAYYLLTPESP